MVGLWDRHSSKGHTSVDLGAPRKSSSLFGGKAGGFPEEAVLQQDLDGWIEHARVAKAAWLPGRRSAEGHLGAAGPWRGVWPERSPGRLP